MIGRLSPLFCIAIVMACLVITAQASLDNHRRYQRYEMSPYDQIPLFSLPHGLSFLSTLRATLAPLLSTIMMIYR